MKNAAVVSVVVVAILVGAAGGFEYEYLNLSSKVSGLNQTVSDLNQTVSSQLQQISSLGSEVPDNEIFGVAYTMTLWSHVNTGLSARSFYTIWDLGIPYHTGENVTIYIDVSQLFNYTGLMNITNIRVTEGFNVLSISPSLPVVVNSGVTSVVNRSVLDVVLSTPSNWYRGFLQVYIQAYTS